MAGRQVIESTKGPLIDPKHEKFACELAAGKKPIDAYRLAGYGPDRGNAARMAKYDYIERRVAELVKLDTEFAGVTRVKTVVQIDRVARANIFDFYDVVSRPNGEYALKLKKLDDLPREVTDAVKAIKQRDDGSVELELWDKNAANFTLLKYLGGLPDERPGSTQINIFGDLSLDDQLALAAALEAQPEPKGKTIDGEAKEVPKEAAE